MRQETSALLDQLETGALRHDEAPDRIDEAYKAVAEAAGDELIKIHGLADEPGYVGSGGKMKTRQLQGITTIHKGRKRRPDF